MKLIEACDLGWACGCETIDEAIGMIIAHSTEIFIISDIDKEIDELMIESRQYPHNTKIADIFPAEVEAWENEFRSVEL